MTDDNWYLLPAPPAWGAAERRAFFSLAGGIRESSAIGDPPVRATRRACTESGTASLAAAACVLCDLASQGWDIEAGDEVRVRPARSAAGMAEEKQRIRRQEHLKRDEQLSRPSVRAFITGMERPREYHGAFVSIFSLM